MDARVNLLGVGVNPTDLSLTVTQISRWIEGREKHYVCLAPIHAILDVYQDDVLRGIYNSSSLTVPDGMGVVWVLKAMGYRGVGRVYGPDLMLKLIDHGQQRGTRHFFYGGASGVAEDLKRALAVRHVHAEIVGTYAPPYRSLTTSEEDEVLARINDVHPDIVWVGLGSPKQDSWMSAYRERLDAPVLIGVGAAFDFLSGRKPQAPRWIQRSGFEWLFRLATEPKRLWPRYRQYPLFVWFVLLQLLGLKEFPIK